MRATEDWWQSGEASLVLLGGKGCGKTHAACWIISQHCEDRSKRAFAHTPGDLPPWWVWLGARFVTARHMAGLKAWDEEDRAELRLLTATSLLIVDDLGTEDGGAERSVGSLLAARADSEKRTVLTSNLGGENFARRYGERVLSRIMGNGRLAQCHGPDLRQDAT